MISWIEEVRLDSRSALGEQAYGVNPGFGGLFSDVGEPGADSTIIVVEKDRPRKWQRITLHVDLGLLADCKSFRTGEPSNREPRLVVRLLGAPRPLWRRAPRTLGVRRLCLRVPNRLPLPR